jgi:YfiH family protein
VNCKGEGSDATCGKLLCCAVPRQCKLETDMRPPREQMPLKSALLEGSGIRHEFGQRESAPAPANLATARQVHGKAFFWPTAPGAHSVDADVLLGRRGLALGIVTADCVPILLSAPKAALGAAIHAGWRGTLAGAVDSAVRALIGEGVSAKDLFAAIGPSVGPCCYEVSADLAARFTERFGAKVGLSVRQRTLLDLQLANVLSLEELGLTPQRIEVMRLCTRCATAPDGTPRFHSFRRDGHAAGRQISYLEP